MATSGSKTHAIFSWIDMKFSWWQNSQSVATNSTNIGWKLELITDSSGAVYKKNRTWTVVIDGVTYTGKVDVSIDKSDRQTVAQGTATIYHSSDGSKTFAYSFQQQFELTLNSGKYMSTYTGNGSDTLEKIALASVLTVGNGTLGQAQTISVSKRASGSTHTITWACGSESGTICTNNGGTSYSWTPPLSLASQSPNRNDVSVVFTIATFIDGASAGSYNVPISCAIPYTADFQPVIPYPSFKDASGYDQLCGGWVQWHSKLQLGLAPYGKYGATIKAVQTVFDGATYTTAEFTSGVISQSGIVQLIVTVTDTRDRVTVNSWEISVQAYTLPKITNLVATRCDADGTLNPYGSYMKATFSAEITSLNGNNTAKYYVGYKKKSDEEHEAIELTALKNVYNVNSSYVFPADPKYTYDVIFTALDRFSQARTVTDGASAEKVFSLLKKDGKIVGMAVGKVAEEEGVFDIGWLPKLSGGGDIVIEQGEKDGWFYRKWQSGIMECQKICTIVTKISKTWGSMYVGNTMMERQSYPFPFLTKPVEVASLTSGYAGVWLFTESQGNGVNGAYASAIYNVCRPSANSDENTFYISLYATGRWK